MKSVCKCGCGKVVKEGKKFIWGHNRRNKKSWSKGLTKKTNNILKNISEKLKGKHISPNTEFKKGNKHRGWKGGRVKTNRGYIEIYKPNHFFANKLRRVAEHRLVMEKHIGRYLTKDEIVHHKNRTKTDNRIKNLQLMTKTEHNKLNNAIKIAYKFKTKEDYKKGWETRRKLYGDNGRR